VNLIVTGRENTSIEVEQLRNRHCAVEIVPSDKLLDCLRSPVDLLLFADVIVCFIEVDVAELTSPLTYPVGMIAGQRLTQEVRRLPETRAMPDGRKWKTIPIVIVLSGTASSFFREELQRFASAESAVFVEALLEFGPTFSSIDRTVREYRQRILAEFSNLGFLVSYRDGRYRVGPAMNPDRDLEGLFYFGPGDKRHLDGRCFTVDRNVYGIQYEVEQFEGLINSSETSEPELQAFFEEHPHFLSDARLSSPLSHVRLEDQSGAALIPDFIIKPIVAYRRDSNWQVLDLKKPGARLLAGPARHIRLSHEVTQAITQLRDYGGYFGNPENSDRIAEILGHRLRYPELAVLIGRLGEYDVEMLNKAQSRERDVRIVTYDEVLERQQRLLE
jgi:Domain of unknown function (DUF4263)